MSSLPVGDVNGVSGSGVDPYIVGDCSTSGGRRDCMKTHDESTSSKWLGLSAPGLVVPKLGSDGSWGIGKLRGSLGLLDLSGVIHDGGLMIFETGTG